MDIISSLETKLTGQSIIILTTCISAVCFVLIGIHFYYKNAFSYWEKKGLKGPKPWPVVGNFLEMLLSDRPKLESEWQRKYGKVYGIYQGKKPLVVVADPEVLQQICIKDFDAFPNHDLSKFANKYQRNFIIFLRDDHWKKVRALMSPTFTSGKIKRMFRFLDDCADDLVQVFREQLPDDGRSERSAIVNAKDLYYLFTMDTITTCCYGLKLERVGSKDLKTAATRNDFIKTAMKLFRIDLLRLMVGAFTPEPILKLVGFQASSESKVEPLAARVKQLIINRKNSPKKFDDYLQLLIDARLDNKMELDEMDSIENHHAGLTNASLLEDQKRMVELALESKGKSSQDVVLSDIETLTGAIFLLAVGLETTGTLLTHCTYVLAFHKDIQEKLYQELIKIAEFNEDKSKLTFTYEGITSCNYLDAVLSETLRILPPIIQLDRVSNREYRIEKYNLDIAKNQRVLLAYHAILNDPDNWEKPDQFIPDRFLPGNKEKIVPGAYCPFGIGPRHCLGMRFSLTEAKLALAKIMLNFRFEPAPDTRFPPEKKLTLVLHNIKTPTVKVIARSTKLNG